MDWIGLITAAGKVVVAIIKAIGRAFACIKCKNRKNKKSKTPRKEKKKN